MGQKPHVKERDEVVQSSPNPDPPQVCQRIRKDTNSLIDKEAADARERDYTY
jgi:hypothetical protein